MLTYLCSVEINPVHNGTALNSNLGDEALQRQKVLAGNLIAELKESSDLFSSCLFLDKERVARSISFSLGDR